MIHQWKVILDTWTVKPRQLFLLDGLGATLTAFCLGAVLPRFEEKVGMDPKTLYCLAAVAFLYAVYSIGCYFFTKKNWRSFLKGIGLANLVYCLLTLPISGICYDRLTTFGVAYFGIEILVISLLTLLEFRAATNQET